MSGQTLALRRRTVAVIKSNQLALLRLKFVHTTFEALVCQFVSWFRAGNRPRVVSQSRQLLRVSFIFLTHLFCYTKKIALRIALVSPPELSYFRRHAINCFIR